MRKEYYLNELKAKLYDEVANYYLLENEKEKLESKYYCLREAVDLLSDDNIYDIYENRFSLFTLLESCLSEEDYKNYYRRLSTIIYKYFDNNGRPTVDDEEIYEALDIFRQLLNRKYLTLAMEVNDFRHTVEEAKMVSNAYKKIQYALKNNIELRGAQVPILKTYMDNHGFTDEQKIMINEAIRTHNIKSKNHLDEAPSSYVEKMINTPLRPFYIPDEVEESLNGDYFPIVESYYKSFNQTSLSEMGAFVSYLPKFEEGYEADEFKYIYKKLLNMVINDIFEVVEDIRDMDVYNDPELRNITTNSYFELIKKYYAIFNYFKQEIVKYHEDIQELEEMEEEDLDSEKYVNKLVYMSSNGVSKLEKGLKKVTKEYYDRVLSLLERKKKGVLPSSKDSVMKATNDKLKGFGKLEEDQVRILYKPLGNNVYMIIGGFVKKDTKDFTGYYALAEEYRNTKHPSVEELLAEAPAVEAHLNEYIEDHKRKQQR